MADRMYSVPLHPGAPPPVSIGEPQLLSLQPHEGVCQEGGHRPGRSDAERHSLRPQGVLVFQLRPKAAETRVSFAFLKCTASSMATP